MIGHRSPRCIPGDEYSRRLDSVIGLIYRFNAVDRLKR
jgi:hypothetical protein